MSALTAPAPAPAIQSERALIGAILQAPDAVLPVVEAAGLTAASFTEPVCALALEAIARLRAGRAVVDVVSVSEEMPGDASENAIDLGECISACPTITHAAYYCDQVRAADRRRKLSDAARMASDALAKGGAVDVVAAQLRAASEAAEGGGSGTPLPMMKAGDLLDSEIPPRIDLVGEAMLYLGGTASIVAPAGTGKTRALIQMACCSLAGVPFGPLKCSRYVGKWLLFCGNENSQRRYKADLVAMLSQFGAEERETIRQNVLVHVAESYDDFVGPDSMDRVTATVRACGGDSVAVVAFDPTGDIIAGDANADVDVRAMLRETGQAVRRAARDACIVYVHHAREGRLDVAQATGWGRGNFSKGSKALHACVRAAFHLAPSDSGESGGILVACGKCNDVKRFEPFGMRLEGGVYVHDADFDAEAWRADVEGRMRTRPKRPRLTDVAALACLGDDTDTSTGVRSRLREKAGATRDDADDACRRLVLSGDWVQWRPNFKNAPTYIGPPKAMERRKAEIKEKLQLELA